MKKKPALELKSDNLSHAPTLRGLLSRAELHQRAETRVLAAIPEAFAAGVRFISSVDGKITISAESSTQASQLRLRQHEIMASLREDPMFEYVWSFRIKVAPPRFRHESKPEKLYLSNENARLLREEAEHTKDKALREVLEKLASHVPD